MKGPRIIQSYETLRPEKSITNGFNKLSVPYAKSSIRYFEGCLRIVIGWREDDNQLILKQ